MSPLQRLNNRDGKLSAIHAYANQGYAVIENAISSETCLALKQRSQELVYNFKLSCVCDDFLLRSDAYLNTESVSDLSNRNNFYFEKEAFSEKGKLLYPIEKSINKITFSLHKLDSLFQSFSNSSEIREVVKCIGKEHARIVQSMYIFKQAHIGDQVDFHQDATFLHAFPSPAFAVWIALEDATIDNGCLWVLPGWHDQPLRNFLTRNSTGLVLEVYDPTSWPEDKAIPLEVKAGTAIVLHAHLPHGSHPNRSTRTRQAYSMHFIEEGSHLLESCWLEGN